MSQSEKEIAREAYIAYQEKLNLEPGDIVKIAFKATSEYQGGSTAGWVEEMNQFFGQELEVLGESDNSLMLKCGNEVWYFPAFCLEVVSRKADEKTKHCGQWEIEALTKKLHDVFNAGHDGIRYVGSANYQSREDEAIMKLNEAMDSEK